VSSRARKLLSFFGTVGLALAVGLLIGPITRHGVSPVTAGIVVGVLGTLCLVGVAFGLWDARRIEAKRRAKEQIWIKH
jgi:hypothetical protein